jgi:hypothetical protein
MNTVSAILCNSCTASVQYERIKDTRWYFCQTGKKAKNNKELSRRQKKKKRAEREGMQGTANKQWFCVFPVMRLHDARRHDEG